MSEVSESIQKKYTKDLEEAIKSEPLLKDLGFCDDDKTEFCEWYNDRFDEEMYETCGPSFSFYEGGVAANEFKFCPFCGRPIKEVSPEEEDDDE